MSIKFRIKESFKMSKHHPDDILDKVQHAHDLYEMTETSDYDDAWYALHDAVKMIAENMATSSDNANRWILRDGTNVLQRLEDISLIPTSMTRAAILSLIQSMKAES